MSDNIVRSASSALESNKDHQNEIRIRILRVSNWRLLAVSVACLAFIAAGARPASAQYRFYEQDKIVTRTAKTGMFDGGVVNWYKDRSTTPDTSLGEIRNGAVYNVALYRYPYCNLAKVTWERYFVSPTVGWPPSLTVGVTKTSDGFLKACRPANSPSRRPPTIFLTGARMASKALKAVLITICHQDTPYSTPSCSPNRYSLGDQ